MASHKILADHEYEGLQLASNGGDLETVPKRTGSPVEKPFLEPDFLASSQQSKDIQYSSKQRKRILGIPVFWLLIVIMTFIIGAATGAGFAALGLKNQNKSASKYVRVVVPKDIAKVSIDHRQARPHRR